MSHCSCVPNTWLVIAARPFWIASLFPLFEHTQFRKHLDKWDIVLVVSSLCFLFCFISNSRLVKFFNVWFLSLIFFIDASTSLLTLANVVESLSIIRFSTALFWVCRCLSIPTHISGSIGFELWPQFLLQSCAVDGTWCFFWVVTETAVFISCCVRHTFSCRLADQSCMTLKNENKNTL